MIIRPRQSSLSPVAVAAASAALLLGSSPAALGAPVVVTDYKQLVGTIGSNDDYGTGERFSREGIVLVHKGDESCSPDFDLLGLSGFDKHPEMYSLVSVDAEHADKELLDKLGVDPAILSKPSKCPSLSVVPRRSTVEAPAVSLPALDKKGSYHLNAVKTQQVSVGIVNEMDFPLDIHYQWWDDPARPTHIRTLSPGTENWMLSFKTTVVLALNKETQEEVSRFLVKGHGLFTVAERSCTAETCGTSEGAET
ncbi:unnamed protein product, partial [Ectocarpus fasciculatus]